MCKWQSQCLHTSKVTTMCLCTWMANPTSITKAMGRYEIKRHKRTSRKKRCKICPAAKDRKISIWCSQCTRPVCKEHKHVVVICEACEHWDASLHRTYVTLFHQCNSFTLLQFTTVMWDTLQFNICLRLSVICLLCVTKRQTLSNIKRIIVWSKNC